MLSLPLRVASPMPAMRLPKAARRPRFALLALAAALTMQVARSAGPQMSALGYSPAASRQAGV